MCHGEQTTENCIYMNDITGLFRSGFELALSDIWIYRMSNESPTFHNCMVAWFSRPWVWRDGSLGALSNMGMRKGRSSPRYTARCQCAAQVVKAQRTHSANMTRRRRSAPSFSPATLHLGLGWDWEVAYIHPYEKACKNVASSREYLFLWFYGLGGVGVTALVWS